MTAEGLAIHLSHFLASDTHDGSVQVPPLPAATLPSRRARHQPQNIARRSFAVGIARRATRARTRRGSRRCSGRIHALTSPLRSPDLFTDIDVPLDPLSTTAPDDHHRPQHVYSCATSACNIVHTFRLRPHRAHFVFFAVKRRKEWWCLSGGAGTAILDHRERKAF